MALVQRTAWANPSSLHGPGLLAAEALERSRQRLAECLGAGERTLTFCSGASEAIHLALVGQARALAPGRLVISAVEHPATLAAADQLRRLGWTVAVLPVDRRGMIRLEALETLLEPPTRLVSLIWGQSEVGSLQPLEAAGRLCRAASIPLHVDAVQVVGHRPLDLAALPIDLLSCAAHKLQGPRGIGLLVHRPDLPLLPLVGGAQEAGLRGGTEPVVLAVGFAQALEEATSRLERHGGRDPIHQLRDRLLAQLLALPGLRLSGPDPRTGEQRLPHHISLLVACEGGIPLAGRDLVRGLARRGLAVSSGSACSALSPSGAPLGSAVLRAMGYGEAEAASGLRISLGPWHGGAELDQLPACLDAVRRDLADSVGTPR
jgi:cysteine desulfurase